MHTALWNRYQDVASFPLCLSWIFPMFVNLTIFEWIDQFFHLQWLLEYGIPHHLVIDIHQIGQSSSNLHNKTQHIYHVQQGRENKSAWWCKGEWGFDFHGQDEFSDFSLCIFSILKWTFHWQMICDLERFVWLLLKKQ